MWDISKLLLVPQDATEAVQKLQKLVPDYRARPSLLNPVWSAVGLALGTAAAVAPTKLAAAISGANPYTKCCKCSTHRCVWLT